MAYVHCARPYGRVKHLSVTASAAPRACDPTASAELDAASAANADANDADGGPPAYVGRTVAASLYAMVYTHREPALLVLFEWDGERAGRELFRALLVPEAVELLSRVASGLREDLQRCIASPRETAATAIERDRAGLALVDALVVFARDGLAAHDLRESRPTETAPAPSLAEATPPRRRRGRHAA